MGAYFYYKHSVLTQSNADIIYCFTSLAKLQQDPKVAEHLVDFCDYFIQAAQAEDAAFTKVAKTMARGTILGVRDNLRYTAQVWKKRLADPVGTFKDELIAYKKAGEALGRALSLAVTNPKVLGEKAYEKFENIVSGAQGDPDQFFASVVSFLLPTDPVGNRLKKQFAQGLKSALKKQKKLAEKLLSKKTPKQAQQAINPLPDISKSSQPILLKSFEKTGKNVKSGVQKSVQKAKIKKPYGKFENAPYHNKIGNAIKSKAPTDGQAALNSSLSIGPNTNRRIGVSNGEFVVLDQTLPGLYHGHVRLWNDLTDAMKKTLTKKGLVTRKGKIIKKK